MDNEQPTMAAAETVAQLLVRDLAPIGSVTYAQRLSGIALLEDGVMFGYVDAAGTPYLRTTLVSGREFHALGSRKHPEMPYWSIPHVVSADITRLREVAYEAADAAHLAFSFDIDDTELIVLTRSTMLRSAVALVLSAA